MDDPITRTLPHLRHIEAEFSALVHDFQPERLGPDSLQVALEIMARVERLAAAAGALVAGQLAVLDEGGDHRHRYLRQAALVHKCSVMWGTDGREARKTIEAGRRAGEQPLVAGALLDGRLSLRQSRLITQTTEADPGAVHYLLQTAATRPARALSAECTRLNSRRVTTDEGCRRKDQPGRLRVWADRSGDWHLSAVGPASEVSQIMDAIAREMVGLARPGAATATATAAPRPSAGVLEFEALVSLARRRLSDGPPPVLNKPYCWPSKARTSRPRRQQSFGLSPESLEWLFGPTSTGRQDPTSADAFTTGPDAIAPTAKALPLNLRQRPRRLRPG